MTSTGATIGPGSSTAANRTIIRPGGASTSQPPLPAAHAQLIAGWLSVAVMGSCGIGHFAPGRDAVGLGLNKRADSGARAGPSQMRVPSARSTAGQFGGRTAGLYGRGNLMTTTSREEPPDTACACGHTAEEHDSVAARYCRATADGAMGRRCICIPASMPRPR